MDQVPAGALKQNSQSVVASPAANQPASQSGAASRPPANQSPAAGPSDCRPVLPERNKPAGA
eukprot:1185860-Prorocentrum_minimum.AAC.1